MCFAVQPLECIVQRADGIAQPDIYRFLRAENRADIRRQCAGFHHAPVQLVLFDRGIVHDKARNARLDLPKVFIGLWGTNNRAADAHRMQHHRGRRGDERALCRNGKRNADRMSDRKSVV